MSANIDKMSIVIKNYFSDECDVDTTVRQAYERGFRRGASKCDVLNMRKRELSDEYGKLNEEHVKLNEEYAELQKFVYDMWNDMNVYYAQHESPDSSDMDFYRDRMRELGIEVEL